jgi:hypothetical protein
MRHCTFLAVKILAFESSDALINLVGACTKAYDMQIGNDAPIETETSFIELSDFSIRCFIIASQKVSFMSISNCVNLGDRSIELMIQSSLPRINELWLMGCNSSSDCALHSISKLRTRLWRSYLDDGYYFTVCGLSFILIRCSNLRLLSLNNCIRLSFNYLDPKLTEKVSLLERVSFRKCYLTDDISLETFLSWVGVSLQILDISHCKKFTDKALLSVHPKLIVLNVSNKNIQ